eukprot:1753153-Ditylum_brightwellii.AAC.1
MLRHTTTTKKGLSTLIHPVQIDIWGIHEGCDATFGCQSSHTAKKRVEDMCLFVTFQSASRGSTE